MRKHPVSIFLITSFFLLARAHAAEMSSPFMPAIESFRTKTVDHKTSKLLSRVTIQVEKESFPDGDIFIITQKGQGHIDRYKNAAWITQARMKEVDGFLRTLESSFDITDSQGVPLAAYKKIYDYEKNTIVWTVYDGKGRVSRTAQFPLKGKTCDNTTLIFFLKAFMGKKDATDSFFYLLTNEPKLFKTKIKFVGEETLDLPGTGPVKAVKIKLTADIGILDDILDRFVPKTFVWYSAEPPYHWLKYQGFEKDAGSHYIISSRVE